MQKYLIGVIGPCAAGKTTLIAALITRGYQVKHIAQEHSYVANMWKRLSNPDTLVYLDVSFPLTVERRNLDLTRKEYNEQLHRLRLARTHADYYLNTDELSPQEVLDLVLTYLRGLDQA